MIIIERRILSQNQKFDEKHPHDANKRFDNMGISIEYVNLQLVSIEMQIDS